MKPLSMSDLISVGQCFYGISIPDVLGPLSWHREVRTFLELLEKCELLATLAVAKGSIGAYQNPNEVPLQAGKFTEQLSAYIRSSARSIGHALTHEVTGKQLVILQFVLAAVRLRKLSSTNQTQQRLAEETIRCMEVEAYRAAIVMAWNFAFEWIRQWVFDNHLVAFNAALVVRHPQRTQITDYDDFFTAARPLGEFDFLDLLQGIGGQQGIVRGKTIASLQHFLRDRNNHAHSNFITPTQSKTSAYIEQLLDILESGEFR